MTLVVKDSIDLIGNTPLLQVKNINTGLCNLYLKLESFNLGGSIKDRPAKNMIEMAVKKKKLKPGGTIVEATAGNTGIALAIMALKKGFKMIVVVPDKMTIEKVYHLRALGAEVIITRSDVNKGHPEYYLDIAKKIAAKKNAFYINQFDNKANLDSHYKMLGPEIFNQLKGKVDAFVAGVGTGGTITGVGKFLKKKIKKFDLVLADPKGSILKELVDTGKVSKNVGSWFVEGIGEDFCPPLFDKSLIDHAYTVTDKEALETCNIILKKEGVLAGSSSGTLIAAAIKYCKEQQIKKNVVTLVCDAGDKYLRKVYNDSWKIRTGLHSKKSSKDIVGIISYPANSNTMPRINENSNCALAFKLMNENSLDKLLVENNNKKIIGVIDEDSLFNAVQASSFKGKIKNFVITKVKKIKHNFDIEKLLILFKKEKFVFVYKDNRFKGMISKNDLLSYLNRNENA
ncbi:pyridoxal-phosphate dependent enzyme [Alphaproteobacteria bacterium]|nr:pyridoxal-phosphate dependent enzyme [Alphaproteobacteria bacterium]